MRTLQEEAMRIVESGVTTLARGHALDLHDGGLK